MTDLVLHDPTPGRPVIVLESTSKRDPLKTEALIVAKALQQLGRCFRQPRTTSLAILLPKRFLIVWDERDDSNIPKLFPEKMRYKYIFVSRRQIHALGFKAVIEDLLNEQEVPSRFVSNPHNIRRAR